MQLLSYGDTKTFTKLDSEWRQVVGGWFNHHGRRKADIYDLVVGQYMIAAKEANDFNVTKKTVSNMVFMGQGEPLYNWRQVRQAIQVLTDTNGIAMPKHKITVSTSGVVPLIPNVASDVGVSLAISLHATRNDLRDVLVPLNKTFPLELVLEACTTYAQLMGNRGRRITFE